MANQSITEAASRYLMEGSAIVKKWGVRINEVNSLFNESKQSPLNLEQQVALAKILENTQKRISYDLNESTQNTMVGPYKKYALDIITGMVPNLIAFDLVNVQPIENKMGIINYIKYSAGSAKGNTAANSEWATTFNYTGSDKQYTQQAVTSQPLTYVADSGDASLLNFVLPWKPVVPGSVKLTIGVGGNAIIAVDVPATSSLVGTGANAAGVTSGTINYSTGVVSINYAQNVAGGTEAVADWSYNNEYAPVDVPEINLSIESIPVLARSRKLKALWSFDAAYEMQKEYGQDLNGLLAAQAAAEIAHEIDVEILDDLYNMAFTSVTQPALTWNASVPVGVSQAQHFESLKTVFNRASNRIFQNTKRAMGNFAVVGTNVATVLESTPSFKASDLGSNIGPYLLGTWGGFKVYKNPFFAPDAYVIGYKGNNLFDAGYCYAPYMPVCTTQMLMLADFQGQQGWATSYGKTILNNYMYVPGTITGLV